MSHWRDNFILDGTEKIEIQDGERTEDRRQSWALRGGHFT